LPLLAGLLTLLALIAQPAVNAYERRVEGEADAFAIELTHDMNMVLPLLVAVTERRTTADIDRLAQVLS